jgi:hypothetical protein
LNIPHLKIQSPKCFKIQNLLSIKKMLKKIETWDQTLWLTTIISGYLKNKLKQVVERKALNLNPHTAKKTKQTKNAKLKILEPFGFQIFCLGMPSW